MTYRSRHDDARIAALIEDWTLREVGVIEPDQPTAYSHAAYMAAYRKRMYGEFTPEERHKIRLELGLGVEDGRRR